MQTRVTSDAAKHDARLNHLSGVHRCVTMEHFLEIDQGRSLEYERQALTLACTTKMLSRPTRPEDRNRRILYLPRPCCTQHAWTHILAAIRLFTCQRADSYYVAFSSKFAVDNFF